MAKVRAFTKAIQPVLDEITITQNGVYTPPSDIDGYNKITAMFPIPIITTKNITANGTYNASDDGATGYSSVTVNVTGGQALIMNREPLSGDGSNGDTFIHYGTGADVVLVTTVNSGYNGGAKVKCYVDGTNILDATGDSPYNLDYDIKTGSTTKYGRRP